MNIKDRQCLLAFLKRSDGTSYYTGSVDGIWGPLSREAVLDFQQALGLPATGEADPETDLAMRQAVAYDIPEAETGTAEDPAPTDFWDEIEFFGRDEMKCKCRGEYCSGFPHPIQPLLMQILDRARRWTGHPIVIVSGLRCPQWNRIQKGVANSQHMFGEAADVYFYGVSPKAALAWLQSQPDVRYAYRIEGSSNIHFDIQPVGR